MNIPILKKLLADFYNPTGSERIGYIVGNKVIEVANVSPKPEEGFLYSDADIAKYTDDDKCTGTWHTHPNQDSNLSGEDFRMFTMWKDLTHFIIGNDGVSAYKFDNNKNALLEIE